MHKKFNMMKTLLVLLSFVFVLTSCKGDKETTNDASQKEETTIEKPFTVELQMKVKEDDVICLYYKDLSISFFNEDMSIYKNLNKSDVSQSMIFTLPKDFVPNDFRFDLSCQNKDQKIYVEKIIFNFRNETFTISNEDIDKYLEPNDEAVFNLANRTYTFKEAKKGPYDPFLRTTGQFYPLLEKLVGYEAFPHQQQ